MDEFGERRGFRRRGGFGGYSSAPKPVAVGDVLEVTIDAVGSRGDGIAKKDGFVIFVKGASQGQRVKIKIVSIGRTCATAEVVSEEAAVPSPEQPAAEQVGEEEGAGNAEDLQ